MGDIKDGDRKLNWGTTKLSYPTLTRSTWADLIDRVFKQLAGEPMNEKKKEETEDRFKNTDIGIQREGTKIVLPSDPFPMRYDEAITAIQRRMAEESTRVGINEEVNAYPLDGAYAFMRAMQQVYGWASPTPTKGFFGQENPPQTVSLEIDFEVYAPVIWGTFKIPGIEGELKTGVTQKDGRLIFCIQGTVQKKYQAEVAKLAEVTREIVRTQSVYRAKAFVLRTNDDGDLDLSNPPKFLDLSRVNPNELTFSEDVEAQVRTNLFTPIEYTAACKTHQIPLKRGVLLEGPFGTGKTLTAFVTATKCRENGWTFVMVDRVAGLGTALAFARQYQPAVVFAEDVDRAMSGDRDEDMDDVLNTIDGIGSKGTEIITVLTSNEVANINRAMLRPGRLDAIIPIHAPDAKAAAKLVRLYARGLIAESENLDAVGEELAGQIPAVIREVVERSKLYAISRQKGEGTAVLSAPDLLHAAKGMKRHLELMYPQAATAASAHERLGLTLGEIVRSSVSDNEKVLTIERQVAEVSSRLN